MSNGEARQATADTTLRIVLDFIEPIPEVLDVGAPFELIVAVSCDAPCDLGQAMFEIVEGDLTLAQGVLGAVERPSNDSDAHDPREGPYDHRPRVRLRVPAPSCEGYFQWRLVLPAQEIANANLARAELPFAFATGQHHTSLAAWDVPSPVQSGGKFRMRIGAKCSAGCNLSGVPVTATDSVGRTMGESVLGPVPEVTGLYGCEIEITAPEPTGLHSCLLEIKPKTLNLPHRSASGAITFAVEPPAAHSVQIVIRARDTGEPLSDAHVRLGLHRTTTNEKGAACFRVASGPHRLFVWKPDHAFAELTVDVQQDRELTITGDAVAKKDPYSRWDG